MARIMLKVAYDGTGYSGWQIQPNATTIEGCLNEALSKLTGTDVEVIGASRTDAGVHALGNIAVFDYEGTIPADKFKFALAPLLPPDIVVVESTQVAQDFHPRKCKSGKTYCYTIDNNPFPNPLSLRYAWHVRRTLDLEKMREAAAHLIGEHDFKSFCSVHTQAQSTVRTIFHIDIHKDADNYVKITVTGNGFLYNMVRIIAGTLCQVGTSLWEPTRVKEALEATDRTLGGITAPPQGLKLVEVEFGSKIEFFSN
ncbi:MAG: tRNA pseudouridine(38-40) synthase TruA [Lachnospiraceae bacterium]